jgi:hypothetical protein
MGKQKSQKSSMHVQLPQDNARQKQVTKEVEPYNDS